MPRPTADILHRLDAARQSLRRRRCLRSILRGAGAAALLLLMLAGFDAFWPLQEATATLLTLTTAAIGAAAALVGLVRALFLQPSPLEFAATVEQAHPQLMNSLTCAVEQRGHPPEERSLFGNIVIEKADRLTRGIDLSPLVLPPSLRPSRLIPAAAVLLIVLAAATRTQPVRKAVAWSSGRPAILIQPGDADVPIHTDVTVRATVRRWEDSADIEFADSGGRHRFPMNAESSEHAFTFYDVSAPLDYRVVTPSVTSDWHRIAVYSPPDYRNARLTFSPPAYTGIPERTAEGLTDAAAVEGTTVTVALEMPRGISAEWVVEDSQTAFRSAGSPPSEWIHGFALTRSVAGRIRLEDEAGHAAATEPLRIEAIPDRPPTADVLSPSGDAVVAPDGQLDISALAADDFGLASVALRLGISGERTESADLFKAKTDGPEAETETTVGTTINPADMGLTAGDVVVGSVTATDNRRPEPQQGRSRVFFVEIRPDAEAAEQQQQGEGEGEKEELDIGRLIAESKRLIRMSYDLTSRPADPKASALGELARSLVDLQNGIQQARVQVRKKARQMGMPGDIPHLTQAAEAVETASRLVRNQIADRSIPHQERALSWLVRLAQELRKNSQAASGGQSASGQPQQGQKQQQDRESTPSQQSLGERLDSLREQLSRIADLAQRQAALNENLDAARDLNLSESERRQMASRQDGLQTETRQLTAELRSGQLRPAATLAESATRAMQKTASRARAGALADATREGIRAHSHLLAAEQQLRDAMRRSAGAAIQSLAKQAQDLADKQAAAAEKSRQFAASAPPKDEQDGAREGQKRDRDAAKQTVDALERTASDLQTTFPRAAETLAAAASTARDQRMLAGMKRAENALLYRRYDTAQQEQTQASRRLRSLGHALEDGADQLPRIGRRELMDALRRIQAARNTMKSVAEGEQGKGESQAASVARSRGNMGELLQRLGKQLGEPGLGNLGLLMSEGTGEAPVRKQAAYSAGLLERAARLVERHVVGDDVRQAYRISRQATDVPEKYREVIDEYFRRLSEE